MPIKILDLPEPFTPASRALEVPTPLIESDAYRRLLHELRRYCNGELAGRSFLIAGHRGAGKTTLVFSAFEALLREQDALLYTTPPPGMGPTTPIPTSSLRPLLVLLQGPTLLPHAEEELPLALDGSGKSERRLTEMENVLAQITLGLHRALSQEIVAGFRAHVERTSRGPLARQHEMRELAVQLQIELDDYSGKARLREIWWRGGAMTRGVLYTLRRRTSPYKGQEDYAPLQLDGQGLSELLAVTSVCEAYRRISGTVTRKDETKAGFTRKLERSIEIDAKGKELSQAIVALLAGGAVGAGALTTSIEPPWAVLAGTITALASMATSKISASRSLEGSSSTEDLFIPDLSVATMDRVLPVLLDRLRGAGLAPVFVVDELDKVERLSERIPLMIRRLKKLVAENACFCFLADRSYFEEMSHNTQRVAYSIEHTYFTHQLFIAFRHNDVRAYLEKILDKPADADPANKDEANRIKEEQTDHAVLPYILIHGSQMHPIDLLRQLAQLRDAEGNVALEPGAIRSRRRYQLELLIQLAIELQLEQEAMQEELDRRPAFRRLAHDAMYFISREWEQDEDELKLDEASIEKFEAYLIRRMSVENQKGLVKREDLTFLWKSVQAIAEALASPMTIQVESEKRQLVGPVLDTLRVCVGLGPLLEKVDGEPGVYRWRYRRSGRTARPEVAKPEETPKWRDQANLIREFEHALRDATGGVVDPSTLSTGLGILPTSPAWPSVTTALSRLDSLSESKTHYPEMEEDMAVVRAFSDLLRRNIAAVTKALYWARTLEPWSQGQGLLSTLKTMSEVLNLATLRPEQVIRILYMFGLELWRDTPDDDERLEPADEAGVRTFIPLMFSKQEKAAIGDARRQEIMVQSVEHSWEYWQTRLRGQPVEANVYVVVSALARVGAYFRLKQNLESMTLRDWSVAFWACVMRRSAPLEGKAPAWLAMASLKALGWGGRPVMMNASARAMLFATELSRGEVNQLEGWSFQEPPLLPGSSAFIISSPGAVSDGWHTSSRYAALVLHADEWAALRTIWSSGADGLSKPSDILKSFDFDWPVVDRTAPAAAAENQRPAARKRGAVPASNEEAAFVDFAGMHTGTSSPVPFIVTEGPAVMLPRAMPIVDPKTPEQFFQTLQRMRSAQQAT